MSRALLALVLLLGLTAAAEPRTTLPDVEDEVMCVECGTALNVSSAPVADQEREFIRDRIAEGLTKEQVKAALVAEYGRDVLAVPDSEGFGVTNWLVPVLVTLLGLGGVLVLYRRWRGPERAAATAAGPELDPGEARRLDAELAAFDR